jgi:hypothetical protein
MGHQARQTAFRQVQLRQMGQLSNAGWNCAPQSQVATQLQDSQFSEISNLFNNGTVEVVAAQTHLFNIRAVALYHAW